MIIFDSRIPHRVTPVTKGESGISLEACLGWWDQNYDKIISIHITTMHFYSVEYWQENWETLMDRVENGETIGVENKNGERAVMAPADDELIRLYTDHEEAS